MNMALLHCTQLYINEHGIVTLYTTIYQSQQHKVYGLWVSLSYYILSLQSIQNTDFKISSNLSVQLGCLALYYRHIN